MSARSFALLTMTCVAIATAGCQPEVTPPAPAPVATTTPAPEMPAPALPLPAEAAPAIAAPTIATPSASHGPWMSNVAAAVARAKAEKKDLLLDFTGSDWCTWCIRLQNEVFSKPEFQQFAAEHFVLVELDFPNDKSKITPEIEKQNDELQSKFGIEGFPTILLTDADGRPYAQTGYQQGGPAAYVAHLTELQKNRTVRDEALAAASQVVGIERAKKLNEALSAVPQKTVFTAYVNVVDEIIRLDADNAAGLKGDYEAKLLQARLDVRLKQIDQQVASDPDALLAEIRKIGDEFANFPSGLKQLRLLRLRVLASIGKVDDVTTEVAAALTAEGQSDEDRFELNGLLIQALAGAKRFDEAHKAADAAVRSFSAAGPQAMRTHMLRASLFAQQRKGTEARAALKQARALAGPDLQPRFDAIEARLTADLEAEGTAAPAGVGTPAP